MSQHFVPACGGPGYTIEDDGHINVDGLGRIVRPWDSPTCHGKNVERWRSLISESAAKHGVPEAWIAGMMYQESCGNDRAVSPAGAQGLMQIMPFNAKNLTQEELLDPATNIDIGAKIIRSHANLFKWNVVNVIATYNMGSTRCYAGRYCKHESLWSFDTDCDYVPQCVRGINAAIDHGFSGTGSSLSESSSSSGALAVAAAFVAPFAAWWWWKHNR